MNSHLEELLHELFWKGERPSTPPDLARVIEQLREEWRTGAFERADLLDGGDGDEGSDEEAESAA